MALATPFLRYKCRNCGKPFNVLSHYNITPEALLSVSMSNVNMHTASHRCGADYTATLGVGDLIGAGVEKP